MKRNPAFASGLLLVSLIFAGCGAAEKQELLGRPLVLQLGAKISTASSPQEIDAIQARLAEAKLGVKSREHLGRALEEQRRLLAGAAEMQMNERMAGAQKVLSEIEAASAAVE
jgi:hypothetical protein